MANDYQYILVWKGKSDPMYVGPFKHERTEKGIAGFSADELTAWLTVFRAINEWFEYSDLDDTDGIHPETDEAKTLARQWNLREKARGGDGMAAYLLLQERKYYEYENVYEDNLTPLDK